jgi:hypothetical protein
MACRMAWATTHSGGFRMKSKGSKPARWRSMLVGIAALTALALSAERVARMRRRGRSS